MIRHEWLYLVLVLFTKMTALMVIAIPKIMVQVIGSLNSIQAITAVVGGVRYIKLVTLVASPFLIITNNKEIAPIDKAKTAHMSDRINSGAQIISLVSNRNINGRHITAEAAN